MGSTSAPSISGVTLSGTPAAPTVTVTGSNFGSAAPTATPETCQDGDTGNDYGFGGLEFQDLTESWGAGEAGDCIGLLADLVEQHEGRLHLRQRVRQLRADQRR